MTADDTRYQHVRCVTCGDVVQRIDFHGNPHAAFCSQPKEGERVIMHMIDPVTGDNFDTGRCGGCNRFFRDCTCDRPAGSLVLTAAGYVTETGRPAGRCVRCAAPLHPSDRKCTGCFLPLYDPAVTTRYLAEHPWPEGEP